MRGGEGFPQVGKRGRWPIWVGVGVSEAAGLGPTTSEVNRSWHAKRAGVSTSIQYFGTVDSPVEPYSIQNHIRVGSTSERFKFLSFIIIINVLYWINLLTRYDILISKRFLNSQVGKTLYFFNLVAWTAILPQAENKLQKNA